MAVRDQSSSGDDAGEAPTLTSGATDPPQVSAESELTPGATLGRYRLSARLGAGTMGEVWSAQDPQLDRTVAIKVVHPRLAQSADAAQRLLREARAMAKLSHRAVVTVHDAGEADGRLFLAMELVPGTTLGALLRERTPEAAAHWEPWLAMMLEAGRGLAAAHRRGVLHRDFKPDNVLVDTAGRVCVGDFGLATLFGAAHLATPISVREAKVLDLTTTGALLGTPMYMSPQQLAGEPVDAAADQFAFCVTTHEALYGIRPFVVDATGLGAIAALAAAIDARAVVPAPAGSSVPPAVRDVLVRGLHPDPAARWASVDDLLAALGSASHIAPQPTDSIPRVPPLEVRRRRAALLIAAMLAVGAVVAVALATSRARGVRTSAITMFDAPMRASLAMSADGRYLAVASDRLDIHDLQTKTVETLAVPNVATDPVHVEFEDDVVRVAFGASEPIYRWRPGTKTLTQDTPAIDGLWYGRTVLGELMYRFPPTGPHTMAIVAGGVRRSWPVPHTIQLVAISPDRRRVAYLDADRFSGRIIVRDVLADTEVATPLTAGFTGLAWLDSHTLVYAEGTSTPVVSRVDVSDRGLGPPTVLYRADSGWLGYIVRGGPHLYMIDLAPKPRARVIRRLPKSTSTQDLDFATASVPLGWIGADEFLTWNRTNGAVERRTAIARTGPTGITLSSEPVNATLAGDTLIVSLRRADGRDVYAYPLTGGPPRWNHELTTLVVRCAGDARPPCFAAVVDGNRERLYPIDPATGALGPEIPVELRIEDFAVSPSGDRIAYVGWHRWVVEVALDGTLHQKVPHDLASARSIAFDPTGGYLVAGTLSRSQFQIIHIPDGEPPVELSQTDNDILMLVRPSPSGERVLVLARVYSPVVLQLALP